MLSLRFLNLACQPVTQSWDDQEQLRFHELKAEGKDDETALALTIDSIGDIEQTLQEMAHLSRSLERQVRIHLNAINLQESDFAGVIAHNSKFSVSDLRSFDFGKADLTCSSFDVIDAREANFDGTNLTDCNFSVTDLTDASSANPSLYAPS